MEYCTIMKCSESLFEVKELLDREVNCYSQRGWEPQGGISMCIEKDEEGKKNYILVQAMVRRKNN